jgi:hypothetical protein
VSAPGPVAPRGGSGVTFAILAVAVVAFGLVGGLPDLLGPVVAAVGVAGSATWRRQWPGTGETFGSLPALVALAVLGASSPVAPSTELFGAIAALAVLLWLADDPSRPAGGGRRAAAAIGFCGLGVGIAWSLVLILPRPSGRLGIAGGLLALALLLLAWLLARETAGRAPAGARA